MTGSIARVSAVVLVIVGVLLRLAPHPWNMTPVGAAALFAGARLPLPVSIGVPLATMIASDLVIGVHGLWWATWGACVLAVVIGTWLRRRRGVGVVAGAAVASSFVFFAVTNLAVWAEGLLYPRTAQGLLDCFVAAIPFWRNSLVGDLLWTGVLFGGWALAERVVRTREPATTR
jgi:hypothetical protein